jgi:hypothetical protein
MFNTRTPTQRRLLIGAVSGLIGGIVFAVWAIIATNVLRPALGLEGPNIILEIASIVGSRAVPVGVGLHMVISAMIGAAFGFAASSIVPSKLAVAGLGYGAIWWVLGTLTLLPLMTGQGIQGVTNHFAHAIPDWLPSLGGHLLYGLTTALMYARVSGVRTLTTDARPRA